MKGPNLSTKLFMIKLKEKQNTIGLVKLLPLSFHLLASTMLQKREVDVKASLLG